MRSIIIAHLCLWVFFALDLTPFLMWAQSALDQCQLRFSYATCVTVLR